jgi:transposase InsO family protein
MPFKESSIVSQREELCRLALLPGANVSELGRRFGVSRPTIYKWRDRYRAEGAAGLEDRPRRPRTSPSKTSPEVEALVLGLRKDDPWGGRKLRRMLQDKGMNPVPSGSTITEILRRHGKLNGPRAGQPRDCVRFEHPEPNDLWQMDFKGHFALGEGRCHPLTVLDDHSRFALAIGACGDEGTKTVARWLERLFEQYGLPERILTDNGPPWGTGGPERHTLLTVWLLDLEIRVSHGRPYHPQTQGKDERFHRTLKEELLSRESFADLEAAQARFDAWRDRYNHKRPHQALDYATPASRYRSSGRKMPTRIAPPDYEPQALVRKVDERGWILFKGRRIRCSKAFRGRAVALRATATDGVFDLCYRRHVLAQVDLRQNIAQTVNHVPEHLSPMCPV